MVAFTVVCRLYRFCRWLRPLKYVLVESGCTYRAAENCVCVVAGYSVRCLQSGIPVVADQGLILRLVMSSEYICAFRHTKRTKSVFRSRIIFS